MTWWHRHVIALHHWSLLSSLSFPELQGSLGHHRWFHNQFSPVFSVLRCPLGLGELQACPFPNVVFLPLPLSALSSSPFHCALQDGFGQTWWTRDMTIPLQFASLYNVRSSCGPIACWILARTSLLVTWSLYEIVVSKILDTVVIVSLKTPLLLLFSFCCVLHWNTLPVSLCFLQYTISSQTKTSTDSKQCC